MLSVTILGNNSAVPAFNRHPTSQVVSHDGTNYLVDCGEGTQIQLIKYKIRRGKITHIFISHLHGDHYFGLVGLINTFSLLSHKQENAYLCTSTSSTNYRDAIESGRQYTFLSFVFSYTH